MSDRCPRLLFIARSFPPVATIASIRLSSIARHLTRNGWDVTVLAPEPGLLKEPANHAGLVTLQQEGVSVIHTGMLGRCLLPAFFKQVWPWSTKPVGGLARRTARMLDLDDGIGWIRPALDAAAVLKPGDVDLILASGAPFSSFEIARRLGNRLDCPYVLDYRDPWTQKDFHTRPSQAHTRNLEHRICRDAAAIIHVSPMLVPRHVEEFGGSGRVFSVTNGFDPEVLDAVVPTRFDHRAIVYAGRFYPPHRVIQPVLAALKLIMDAPGDAYSDLRFHYYGVDSGQVNEAAREHGVESLIVDHGRVPQSESFSASKGASINVVVTSVMAQVDQGILGNLPGKLFEVIGLGSPVLLISPEGSQARQILDKSGSGLGFSGSEPENTAAGIRELLGRQPGRTEAADEFSWPSLAKSLDNILRSQLVSGKGPRP